MMTVLQSILSTKMREVHQLIKARDPSSWRDEALSAPPGRNFVAALRGSSHIPIVAEIKRRSVSEGILRSLDDVTPMARAYEQAGASALSVLTDGPFFGGSIEDLAQARGAVSLPVLRKDFIVDPVQVYQSRIAGADAVLLIAAALRPSQMRSLFALSIGLAMTPVVEVHHESELHAVLELNPPIIGINNRDLATLEVNLETCVHLRPLIPRGILVLGESGIRGPEDIAMLQEAGIDAFLIGSTLMRSEEPGAKLAELCRAGV